MAENNYSISQIFDPTFDNLQEAIHAATKKQAVISQNIANAGNPDYTAMDFDAVLDKAVKRSNKKVNLEEELAALSQNTIEHSAYTKLLAAKIAVVRTVVTQGKK